MANLLPGADGKNEEKHLFRIRVDESNLLEANTDAAAAIKGWFSEVQEYGGANGTAAQTQQDDQTGT